MLILVPSELASVGGFSSPPAPPGYIGYPEEGVQVFVQRYRDLPQVPQVMPEDPRRALYLLGTSLSLGRYSHLCRVSTAHKPLDERVFAMSRPPLEVVVCSRRRDSHNYREDHYVAPPYNNYFVDVVGTRKYCYYFSH